MYNRRFNDGHINDSSLTKELRAIKENKMERDMENEILIKKAFEDSFDDKLYNSLKKVLVKLTKAS